MLNRINSFQPTQPVPLDVPEVIEVKRLNKDHVKVIHKSMNIDVESEIFPDINKNWRDTPKFKEDSKSTSYFGTGKVPSFNLNDDP